MIVTIYNMKGSAGKTPIAVNIALDKGWAIGTNEPYHLLDTFIPSERLLTASLDTPFPQIPKGIDVVFDLAGSLSGASVSINTALSQSDLVIIPIYNEVKCLQAGINTIREVQAFTNNIIVVATKLSKARGEVFGNDWTLSEAFLNVTRVVRCRGSESIRVLPLKYSTAFDSIFEHEKSISQLMAHYPLLRHSFKDVNNQFNEIYNEIKHYA